MIIEIKNATASAKADTSGAELRSFKREDGQELLWQGNMKYWGGQAPVLFPIVGALRNGKVKIEGKWYEMGRHGFARRMEYEIADQCEDSVSLKLSSGEASKVYYPFDFCFTVNYRLSDSSLTTEFIVENTGDKIMPFAVGGHPAYNVPILPGEEFEDYRIEFGKTENQKCPVIDLKECLIDFSKSEFGIENSNIIELKHELFYKDALVFSDLNSDEVRIVSSKSGHGIAMDISEFPMLGIWSCVNDGPYVALEPWTGCATAVDEDDNFESKRGMTFLKPGEKQSFAFTTRYF